jgi:hypothetical protein
MKKLLVASLAALLAIATAHAGLTSEEAGEVHADLVLYGPGLGDAGLCDLGFGAQVAYREWLAWPFGASLSLGYAAWQVDSSSDAYKWRDFSKYDGDLSLIPVGVSLHFNLADSDSWDLILSTGLKYVIVDSSATLRDAHDGRKHDIDIDNAVWWDLSLALEYMLSESAYLEIGAGVQTDVLKAETELDDGRDLRDTSFQAFFGSVGLKFVL